MDNQIYNFELSSADERIIRTYECTRMKKLFFPATIGYLTITNKRILFHSTGKTFMGKSELINDMPIGDAVGVSAYIGMSINWLLFILFGIGLYLLTLMLDALLPDFFTSWIFAFLLMLPMGVAWLLTSNLLNEEVREQVFGTLDQQLQGRVTVPRERLMDQPYIRIPFWIGVAILAWYLAIQSRFLGQVPFLNYVILIIAYFLIYLATIGRHRMFSLMIGSKTMKDTGIFIPGDSFHLISRGSTAIGAMSAAPAMHAEQIVRELGAILMDIRQMGDMGAERWQV